jgi:O-acetyl-ADP-ribose deacetylase (regulator of RNase III)
MSRFSRTSPILGPTPFRKRIEVWVAAELPISIGTILYYNMRVVNARDHDIATDIHRTRERAMNQTADQALKIFKEAVVKGVRLRVVRGDLTESHADAIVNAANSHLQHGGGVAGAIVRKGGRIIQEESNRIGFVPVGRAAITGAGLLKARFVIHAVGPMWGEGDEEMKLRSAVRCTLKLATERGFESLAMPAISAGIFGFPKAACAHIIVDEISSFVRSEKTSLKKIDICLMDAEIVGFFEKELEKIRKNMELEP